MQAFISFSSDDRDKVHVLASTLIGAGIEPVIASQELSPGEPLESKVRRLIEDADCVLAFLTDEARENQWVNQEIGYAQATEKRIVPIVSEPEALPALLEGLEFYEMDFDDFEYHCARIADFLRDLAENKGFVVGPTKDVRDDTFELLHLPGAVSCHKCGTPEIHVFVCLLCGQWLCVECGAELPPTERPDPPVSSLSGQS